jgi:lactoylglutathione lyase
MATPSRRRVPVKFRMVYTGIRVKDMDESVRFYTQVLGMKLVGRARVKSTRGEWAQLQSEGSEQLLELNWYAPDSPFYTGWRHGAEMDHLCFAVDDLEGALKELAAQGVERIGGPYFAGGWKMVDVTDPNGICIELGARARSPAPTSGGRRARRSSPVGRARVSNDE